MVTQAFKFRRDLVILIQDRNVLLQLQMRQQLDCIATAAVGQVVDVLLLCQDLPMEGLNMRKIANYLQFF